MECADGVPTCMTSPYRNSRSKNQSEKKEGEAGRLQSTKSTFGLMGMIPFS